jgi:hypothetical protein
MLLLRRASPRRNVEQKSSAQISGIICNLYNDSTASVIWWSQFLRSGLDSRRYQIFGEVVSLERGPLSLVSTTEALLERKSSGSGLERREYGHRDPSR